MKIFASFILLCCIQCFILGSTLKYSAYPLLFSDTSSSRLVTTRLLPGSGVTSFQGESLSLKLFKTGEANVFSPDLQIRHGGLVVEVNGKAVSGQREKVDNNSYRFVYRDMPGLNQVFTLLPDGKLQIGLYGVSETSWNLSLLSEFFGGMTVDIDGKRFAVPQYRQGVEFSNTPFNGLAKRIVFFADIPGKTFSMEFPEAVKVRLWLSGARYGISLRIAPGSAKNDLVMLLEPGIIATNSEQVAEEYTVKSGQYDFWEVDRLRLPDSRGRNLLANSSFEQGFASLWFPHGGGLFSRKLWDEKPIQIDHDTTYAGTASLRIKSDAPATELRQNIATHSVLLTPGTYTVSFYAKTDRPGEQNLRFTYPPLPPGSNLWRRKGWESKDFPLNAEWQRFSYTFQVDATRPQYFMFAANSKVPANCYIDAMQLERGDTATAYEPAPAEGLLITSASDNLVEAGREVNARLLITAKESGTVETVVRDFFGKELKRLKNSFNTGKSTIALDLENLPCGIFTLENRYSLADGRGRYEFTRLAIMKFLQNTHRHKNLYANAYIDPFGVRQFYPEVLERYRKIGIGSRGAFANTEKLVAEEAAKYGVESFSTMLMRQDKSLVAGRPKPCYGFTILNNIVWYETPSVGLKKMDYATITLPEFTGEDLKTIENAAARRSAEAPWVRIWGAINEAEGSIPEFAHSRFASDENYNKYVEIELAAARGIKRGNPLAMVGNSSTSCLRQDRIETLDKLLTTIGDRFRYDCFVIHTYREAPEYPDLDSDFQDLFQMLDKHGYTDTPVYCPEGMHWKPYKMPGMINIDWVDVPWGPLTYDMGNQERLSAAWRARHWLVGLKRQERIKQMNSSTNFWGFEMDCNLTPFANQKISNTLGNLLGNASFVCEVKYSADTRCYLFEDEKRRPVAVVWSCSSEVDQGRKDGPELLFNKAPDWEIFDLMEAPVTVPAKDDGSTSIRLTPFPLFLRGAEGTTANMIVALNNADLNKDSEPAVTVGFAVASSDEYTLTLNNQGKRLFAGTVSVDSRSSDISLKPGEKQLFRAKLPTVLTTERLNHEAFAVEINQNKPFNGKFNLREEFSGLLVRRAAIKVGGSLENWKNIPALDITSRLLSQQLINEKKVISNENFSAKLCVAWSPEALYLMVEVTDDKLAVNPQSALGAGWRNDSLQIFFDTLVDARNNGWRGIGQDDWSYGIYLYPGGEKLYAYRHHVPDIQLTEGIAGAKNDTVDENIQTAFRKTEKGYIYEVAFPQRSLMPFRLAAGEQIGMGVLLNDQDANTPMPQSRLVWGSRAVPPNDRPDLWPLLMLVD